MAKNYNTYTGFGRQVFETVKFVFTAIIIAVLMVTVSQTKAMATSLWEYWTQTDKGYMWTINVAVAVLAGRLVFGRKRGKVIVVLKGLFMFCMTIALECLLWHRKDILGIIVAQMTWSNLILAAGGIVAATIAFIIHIKDVDYGDDESESKEPKHRKKPQGQQQRPQQYPQKQQEEQRRPEPQKEK